MQDDSKDDLVNPLTPWRSMAVIFGLAWIAVLLDGLGFSTARHRASSSFSPLALLLPFGVVLGYAVFWTIWRTAERRHRRLSRARKAALTRQH